MKKLFKKRITLGELAQDTKIFNNNTILDYFKLVFYNNNNKEIYSISFCEDDEEINSDFYQSCEIEEYTSLRILLDFIQSDNLKDLKVKKLNFDEEWDEITFYLDEDIDNLPIKKMKTYDTYLTLENISVQVCLGEKRALNQDQLVDAIKSKLNNSVSKLNCYIFDECQNDDAPMTIKCLKCDFNKMSVETKEILND